MIELKLLSDILYKCDLQEIEGSTDIFVGQITMDSRQVEAGSMFIAIPGLNVDGHQFIPKALESGAVAVLCRELPEKRSPGVTFIRVADTAVAMGIVAANFYGNPSEKMNIVGVTGTNGKTTIATLLHGLFQSLGEKSGLISTISNKIGEQLSLSAYTTPDAIALNELFAKMVTEGCTHCFMEVSSHALHQKRVEGVNFKGAVFTNITHDHLDYHKTFSEYLKVKKKFFDALGKDAFALVNNDDKNGRVMLQNTLATQYSYALKSSADYKGKVLENLLSGLVMQIDNKDVWCKLTGEFNASNIMAVYSSARLLGAESDPVLQAISTLEPVEGRFDYFISSHHVTGIVDYAHTPDALENVLTTIKRLRKGTEQLITVVGCGGNRDAEKRPEMASIAASFSEKVVFTSDNPRNEDPQSIIDDMKAGLDPVKKKKVLEIINRKEAIKTAAALASEGDIVLVAGKGHEKYQEIEGVKIPFDDKLILKEALG